MVVLITYEWNLLRLAQLHQKRTIMKITRLKSHNGFTIIELMIALTVLSIILVIASVLMIQIGSLYSKGVNAATLQNATRNITDDISSGIQFSGGTPGYGSSIPGPPQVNVFCINRTRYTYVLQRELGNDSSYNPVQYTEHVMWRDTMDIDTCLNTLDLSQPDPTSGRPQSITRSVPGSGYEMIPEHVSITRFKIVETPPLGSGVWAIDISTAYGDYDLVVTSDPTGKATCNGGAGTQFCSTANISLTVKRRVQ